MSVRVQLPDVEHWKAQVKCQAGCPVATDAGRYVQLIAEGREEEAYLVARAPNPFASVCGRVCAAPCEDACRRGAIDAPIAIRALKRFVTERYGVESVRPDTQDRLRDEPVGEGNRYAGHLPVAAGASADVGADTTQGRGHRGGARRAVGGARPRAPRLRRSRSSTAPRSRAGMMRFGIPEYRLPAHAHPRRDRQDPRARRRASSSARRSRRPSASPSFAATASRRVFLSVGVSKGRDLHVPGVELDGVVKAVDYLLNVNRGYRMDLGRRVVVIGGGFVAFDAARTALRLRPRGRADHRRPAPRRADGARQGSPRLGARGAPRRRGAR